MRWPAATLGVVVVVAAAGCGGSRPAVSRAPTAKAMSPAGGRFRVPSAESFADPGFHHPVSGRVRLPDDAAGRRVVLTLRDSSRPRQRCAEQHPLSGCVTVDWSDDPARPHVPRSGAFLNAIAVQTTGGTERLYLHPSGKLDRRPEPFAPG